MSQPSSRDIQLSLDALRAEYPQEHRRWVLIGILACLAGYASSTWALIAQHGWQASTRLGDPFVVVSTLVALAIWRSGHTRAAAYVGLFGPFLDIHYSLLTLSIPTVNAIGLVPPSFVIATGLLFGGNASLVSAGILAVTVPLSLWISPRLGMGAGLQSPGMPHFLVALEAVLIATTCMHAAFLRSFAHVLEQHRESEARSRELQTQLQHAQKLEALGLLAGGIAHDFNNLLTAIGGYGALLGSSSDARAREFGSEIVATQRRGALLTRQLLAFARKDISQPKPMDLEHTVQQMSALLERAVGERVRVSIEASPGCTIVADPGRIEQVVLNLAVNARDAMPAGGRLWIRCSAREHEVRLEVEDEGVGMDEATKARIFEPFFTTKERNQGTGLGLSTVHGIVTDSSGRIEVDSRAGHGTRFVVTWPRAALTPEPESPVEVTLHGAGRSVLLVEDNDGARNYVQRLLVDHGFRVMAARSAEDALALVERLDEPPDLLLSDVVMPGLTGPQLAARLRARWPALRCLFMSGYLGDAALGDAFDASADLVPKPFTSPELLSAIGRKLEAAPPQ